MHDKARWGLLLVACEEGAFMGSRVVMATAGSGGGEQCGMRLMSLRLPRDALDWLDADGRCFCGRVRFNCEHHASVLCVDSEEGVVNRH